MEMIKNWLLRTFTLPGTIAITLLIAGSLIFLWILWAIQQAAAAELESRAITAAEHQVCADMPRGSQEMEDRRYECFKRLYEGRWVKANR